MERCSNCGAATRPGAKFCTSCGTRLNLDQQSTGANTGWNTASSTDQTQTATPAVESGQINSEPGIEAPDSRWQEPVEDSTGSSPRRESDDPATSSATWHSSQAANSSVADTPEAPAASASGWSSQWSAAETVDEEAPTSESDEPAARFESALEANGPSMEPDTGADSPSTRTGWSWGSTDTKAAATDQDSMTATPPSPDEASTEPGDGEAVSQAPEATMPGTDPVAFPNEPEADAPGGAGRVAGDDQRVGATVEAMDARQRASALIDELRGLLWKIGEDEQPGDGDIDEMIAVARHVRGETADFSDLEQVIDAVRQNPRDIDALRDLGQQAERLGELLDSHRRITVTLEDVIRRRR